MLGKSKVYTKNFSDVKDSDLEVIGREALQYAKMQSTDVPTVDGFIINSYAFDDFLLYNKLVEPLVNIIKEVKPFITKTAAEASGKITNLFLKSNLQPQLVEQVLEEYKALARSKNLPFVTIEPSHIIGQKYISKTEREIKLADIRGEEDLISAIKFMWLATFSTESLETRANGYYNGEISMAATVKKVCANEITGKVYSISKSSKDYENTLEIESYYGMENLTENTKEFSDIYLVDITKGQIIEKKIFPQERMLVRKGSGNEDKSPYISVAISPEWHRKQKINDEMILEISENFLKVENIFKKPIEVTWCIEAGKIIFVDLKDLIISEKPNTQVNLFTDLKTSIENSAEEKKPKPQFAKLQREIEQMLYQADAKNVDVIQDLINKTTKDIELPTKKNTYKDSKAVNWAQEYSLKTKIYLDITKLNSSNLHSIDYFDGTFFDGTEIILQHDYLPELQFENQNNYNALTDTYTIDITVASQNSMPKNMIYQFSNITELEYKMLGIKEYATLPIGDERFINKPESMIAEVHAINKAKDMYRAENISVSLPGIRNVKNLNGLMQILSLHGLKKSEHLRYFAELSVPSFLYDIEDLKENLVDGLIVNYDTLLRLSVFRGEIKPTDHDVLIKMLHNVTKEGRAKNIKSGVLVYEFDKELLEKLAHCKFDFFIFGNIPSEEEIKAIKKVEEQK